MTARKRKTRTTQTAAVRPGNVPKSDVVDEEKRRDMDNQARQEAGAAPVQYGAPYYTTPELRQVVAELRELSADSLDLTRTEWGEGGRQTIAAERACLLCDRLRTLLGMT